MKKYFPGHCFTNTDNSPGSLHNLQYSNFVKWKTVSFFSICLHVHDMNMTLCAFVFYGVSCFERVPFKEKNYHLLFVPLHKSFGIEFHIAKNGGNLCLKNGLLFSICLHVIRTHVHFHVHLYFMESVVSKGYNSKKKLSSSFGAIA